MPKRAAENEPEIQQILFALAEAPRRIAEIAREVSDARLHHQPAPAWSRR